MVAFFNIFFWFSPDMEMKSSKDGSKYPKCKESFVTIDYRPTKHPIIICGTKR